jgi:hypothetical protein
MTPFVGLVAGMGGFPDFVGAFLPTLGNQLEVFFIYSTAVK